MLLVVWQLGSNLEQDAFQFFKFLQNCGFRKLASKTEDFGIKDDRVRRLFASLCFDHFRLVTNFFDLFCELYCHPAGQGEFFNFGYYALQLSANNIQNECHECRPSK